MMTTEALVVAAAGIVPLMAVIARYDLKELRIPNWTVLAAVAIYLATASWGLPIDIFLWRLGHGVIALLLGFVLYQLVGGSIGGGDLKLIAALTPFVAGQDVGFVLIVYVVASFAGLILHRFVHAMLRGRETGWTALDQRIYFPAGLLLGFTIAIYLVVKLVAALEPYPT